MLFELFPLSNIVVGLLIFVVGFIFHWIAQLISVVNWDYAKKLVFKRKMLPQNSKYTNMQLLWLMF